MNKSVSLILRYLIILLAGLGNLWIFYAIFTKPTAYVSAYLLKLFGETAIIGNNFIFNTVYIELVSACIAGAAYYLLFILGMSIPNIKTKERAYLIFFLFGTFFLVNVLRIIIFTLLAGSLYFEELHYGSWYLLSTIFVVGIWFLAVKNFKIKEMPVYTDVKDLLNQTKKAKRKSKHK
jgi:hypothetical protein